MRRLRQPAAGDWGSVIASLTEALGRTIAGDGTASKLSFRTGAAAKQPIGKPVVMFDWPPGSHTGWGVYGLNLMLHWARRSDLSLCCTQPINPVNLVVNPLEREVIGPVLRASRDAWVRLNGVSGRARLSCPMLNALGNNLSSGRLNLVGTPSIGVVFFETTKFDESVPQHHAQHYSLIVAGSTWNRDLLMALGIDHVRTVLQGVDISVPQKAA